MAVKRKHGSEKDVKDIWWLLVLKGIYLNFMMDFPATQLFLMASRKIRIISISIE